MGRRLDTMAASAIQPGKDGGEFPPNWSGLGQTRVDVMTRSNRDSGKHIRAFRRGDAFYWS
jgi:hypothetical protein